MDNKEKLETQEPSKEEQTEAIKQIIENVNRNNQDDAGPSGLILPGAIPHNLNHLKKIKSGISKSEHNIRQVITSQDVANALKLTSLSFRNTNENNIDLTELKIPILDNKAENESVSLIELKNFMTSCFKRNKNVANVINETSNVTVRSATVNTINNEVTLNIPNVSVITNPLTNETINTIIDLKQPKNELKEISKKRNSGSLSEKSDLGLAQRDSLSSIGSNVCRICMTRGKERLISPCNCKGSLANVHLSCLQRWLNQVGRNHCELCGFSYPAIRTPRYTVLQALRLWFCNPRNRSHLQSDCLIFWLLSTVTAGLLAVCIVGTQYFVIEGNNFGKLDAVRKNEGISHRITETAMDFFMAIVLCGYSVTVYFLWKDHYVMWNRWRRANVNVQLLLTPDSNPVPFVPRSRFNVV